MKRLLIILALFLPVWANAQAFLDNPDFAYGVGISKNEYSADSVAMLALSDAIYKEVSNESNYTIEENNGVISESYTKSVSLSSSIRIAGAKKLVSVLPDGKYKVYYYINKKEYIGSHLGRYVEYMREFSEYEKSDDPHSVNYMLGSLYMAYSEVDDPTLNILSKESAIYKADAASKIEKIYKDCDIYLSARKANSPGWFMVREENSKSLPGFKCVGNDGKWGSPIAFYDYEQMPCGTDKDTYKWGLINIVGRKYRLTYEREIGDSAVEISVPEKFHYDKYLVF
jgi:hypothetical protein